jgi:hypothetical protein
MNKGIEEEKMATGAAYIAMIVHYYKNKADANS